MKKVLGLLVLVIGVFALTGCGGSKSDFTCTAKMEDSGESAKVEFNATLDDNDKIKTLDVTFDFEKEETATQMYTMYNWYNSMVEDESQKIDVSQKGSKITIKNYEKIASSDDEDEMGNVVGMSKDDFKKFLEQTESATEVSCK